jgi:GDP-4-dehydro-6-deoxy-D-mannose reductase
MCTLADIEAEVRQDPARMRLAEQRRMVADTRKIRTDTGWAPQISIETTLTDIINEARNNQ